MKRAITAATHTTTTTAKATCPKGLSQNDSLPAIPELPSRPPPVSVEINFKLTHCRDPDPDRISTSYVERQNLTMRMGMRRFTRLTKGFSRKIENLSHAVSLHFMHYNFARPHRALKERYPRTPAMAAGVTDHIWSLGEIAELLN